MQKYKNFLYFRFYNFHYGSLSCKFINRIDENNIFNYLIMCNINII